MIGHSMGGTVARTAVLLSNHPSSSSCPVKNLILLGSPVGRPAVGLDASMDALYASLNRAWRASFYTHSSACIEAADNDQEFEGNSNSRHARSGGSSSSSASTSGSGEQALAANWRCGKCVAGMRVVSITGGAYIIYIHV